MTSGFFAGVCTTAIMAPGERIKCILQVNKKSILSSANGGLNLLVYNSYKSDFPAW